MTLEWTYKSGGFHYHWFNQFVNIFTTRSIQIQVHSHLNLDIVVGIVNNERKLFQVLNLVEEQTQSGRKALK